MSAADTTPIAVDVLAELAWSIFAPQGGALEKQGSTTRKVWQEIARQVVEADRATRPAPTPASFLLLDGRTPGEVAWKAFCLNADEFYLTAVSETHRVAWERSAQAVIEAAILAGMQGRLDVQAAEERTPSQIETDAFEAMHAVRVEQVAELQTRLAALEADNARLQAELEQARTTPHRRPLPKERPSITRKFRIAGEKGYVTVGLYPDTLQPAEIFAVMAKQGSTLHGLLDAWCRACSLALQYGMPASELAKKFSWFAFEPAGFTDDPQIHAAKSIVDYIARWIDLRFCAPPAQSLPIGLGGALVEGPAAPSTATQSQPVEA